MKFPSLILAKLSTMIRLALLRGLLRLGGFVLRRAMAPAMRAATAHARHTANGARPPVSAQVIDGEFRRIDPRHNDNW